VPLFAKKGECSMREPIADSSTKLERLSPEELAADLLFYREQGCRSARRLAELQELPLALVETLLCRGLATLVSRGFPPELLSAEQLARAAQAPQFGESFRPLSFMWPQVKLPAPRRPEPRADALPMPAEPAPAATAAEPETLDEAALIAELARLLKEEPEALPGCRCCHE
jgi:hypothetical protein